MFGIVIRLESLILRTFECKALSGRDSCMCILEMHGSISAVGTNYMQCADPVRDRDDICNLCLFFNERVLIKCTFHIRFDAHGANYYYPGYARPSQRRTRQTRKNPTVTHLLHLGRERQLWI